ncbi:MAG TPA: ABC transporter ATP-binding protein [Anaerolineae bacterium]|nr:ABC transporter ATP-binding protein [Anaerolineae bacterium]
MNTAIRFEDVSKRFALHQQRSRSFQEALIRLAPWRRTNQNASEEFWALRHVSFEIETGETVGLIGPNGVGKSTALKLVSRILEPTSGHIEVHGRVGALLELGAGFHPDLTGRENVYLNASMMGLSRQEVDRRFDEIVAFSELEPFIDVPVKHYSSGMYVRLGFAVAVHTDPEILLVDEVLAVGDAAFQRKCYDRIDQLRANGVTLLFVSHSAETVRSLCKRALWLDAGTLVADGTAESVVQQYTVHSWEAEEGKLPSPDNVKRWGTGRVQITRVELLDGAGKERQLFKTGEHMVVVIHYHARERVIHPVFGLGIHHNDGTHVTGPNTRFAGLNIPWIEGEGVVYYDLPAVPLLEGKYLISLSAHDWEAAEMFDYHDRLYPFGILPGSEEKYGLLSLGGRWRWKASDSS